jgi:hypothetical protein
MELGQQADVECARLLTRSIAGSLGLNVGTLDLVSTRSIVSALDRSTLALEHTSKDQIGSLLNSTL